jgi:hypothetical protein
MTRGPIVSSSVTSRVGFNKTNKAFDRTFMLHKDQSVKYWQRKMKPDV